MKFRVFKSLVSVLLVSISLMAFPQEVDITWGNARPHLSRDFADSKMAHSVELGTYFIQPTKQSKKAGNIHILEHYDTGLKFKNQVEINLQYSGSALTLESVQVLNGSLYLFASLNNAKENSAILFVSAIDPASLKTAGSFRKVYEVTYPESVRFATDYFNFVSNSEQSHLFIYSNFYNPESKRYEINASVYSDEFRLQWDKLINIPYSNDDVEFIDAKLDNQANIHLAGADNSTKPASGVLFSYLNNGNTSKINTIALDHKVTGININTSSPTQVLTAGIYSSGMDRGSSGIFLAEMDLMKSSMIKKSIPFEDHFDWKGRMGIELGALEKARRFEIQGIELTENGDRYVLAEEVTGLGNRNSILAFKLDNKNNVLWSKSVAKKQNGEGTYKNLLGFSHLLLGDKLYIIYNGHIKHYNQTDLKSMSSFTGMSSHNSPKNAANYLVEFDSDGSFKKRQLSTGVKSLAMFCPPISRKIPGKSLVVYGQTKESRRFIRLAPQ